MKPAFHTMVVSLMTGIFSISVLGIALRLYVQKFKPNLKDTIGKYADFMAWFSAAVGFLLIFAALITGFAIWPIDAVLNSSILKNKIFTALLVLVFWAVFLFVRYRYKIQLWENGPLSIYYSLLGIGAFMWGVIANSIGGDVAGNPSGFEELPRLITVDTRWTFYLPTWTILFILGLGVVALVLPMAVKSQTKEVGPTSFKKAQ